jgi:hypothetical protein
MAVEFYFKFISAVLAIWVILKDPFATTGPSRRTPV